MKEVKKIKAKKSQYLDYKILIPYLLLVAFGMVMVYSSTSYLQYLPNVHGRPPLIYLRNQAIFLVGSFFLMALIYKFKMEFFQLKGLMVVALLGSIFLLLLTLLIGTEINGASGWIYLGAFSIQPAEYFKLILVWYISYLLSRRQNLLQKSFKEFLKENLGPMIMIGIGLVLIMLQPDVGGAAIITFIGIIVVLSSGVAAKIAYAIIGGLGAILVTIPPLIAMVGDKIPFFPKYIYNRFAMYQNPFLDELNTGHQLANGYYAIYNGGWFGLGLGNSIQKKGFLSEAHTDFVFTIVVEEFGVIGAILLLAVLFFLIIHIFKVGRESEKPFNTMMMYGIGGMILVQVFVNLGGVLGLIPMTGVTFPFISQGGNSLVVLSLGIAFALNISADEKRRQEAALENNAIKPEQNFEKSKNVLD